MKAIDIWMEINKKYNITGHNSDDTVRYALDNLCKTEKEKNVLVTLFDRYQKSPHNAGGPDFTLLMNLTKKLADNDVRGKT